MCSCLQGAGRMVLASMILGLLLQWTVVPTLATGIARVAALPADFPAG